MVGPPMPTDIDALRKKLQQIGQEQVLRFWDELDEPRRQRLAGQLAALDLDEIAELVETHVRRKPPADIPAKIEPPNVLPRTADKGREEMYAKALRLGKELLDAGKIGAFLVAGGQGTRLGYDGPKGEFPVTPVREKPLFQVFAEQLLAAVKRHGKPIPWYIMTSELNDAPTRAFFEKHAYFGYPKQDVVFFTQGMMPAFGFDGKMLLAEKDSLALSPDGHGGSLRALAKSGALADMKHRGIAHLPYFQVENPVTRLIDPLFLGLHALYESEMSSKTIPKSHPKEKLGNFGVVESGGERKLIVIEYSDLPDELAEKRDDQGNLLFNAGSIAIHALDVGFIDRLNRSGKLELPWHRAEKKVPFMDDAGREVEPQKPNAVKLEQFVFDAIPMARNPLVYETDRAEEFSPVKNAEGPDSPATSRRDQIRRAARWLAAAGVEVPYREDGEPDAIVEVSPLFADSEEALKARDLPSDRIQAGDRVYYGQ